jgi:hypothetical protein
LASFFFFCMDHGFSQKISRQNVLGTTIPVSLDLQHPLFCWPGPERSPAEPEGRSG